MTDLVLAFGAVLAAAAMGWRALRSTGRARVSWLLIAAGSVCWVVTDLGRLRPGVGEVVSYACTVAGLLLLPRLAGRLWVRWQAVLDVALVVTSLLAVGWTFLLRPSAPGLSMDGDLMDPAWVGGYLLAASVAVAPRSARVGGGPPLPVVLLPYAGLLPAVATVLVAASARAVDLPLLGLAVLVVVLLFARQVLGALESARLAGRLTAAQRTDALTGLANRTGLTERIAAALGAGPVTVLCCDLDGFETVNDCLGHPLGDQLLVATGRRLAAWAGPRDTVARLARAEFAVLVAEPAGPARALEAAESVGSMLRRPYLLGGETVTVSVSTGVAVSGPGDDAAGLLRNAGLAMRRARSRGRSGCAVYEPAMHHAALRRLRLERDLRVAVDDGALRLVYQPIVDLGTGRLAGVETLLRWDGPAGPVDPAEFVPVAEETGLIVPIGRWILDEACAQLAAWRREGHDVLLTVNISARQLLDAELPAEVGLALRRYALPPDRLMLELTETVLVHGGAPAALQRLRALGVRLALDDFGTGWSSLAYLETLPVDTVKLDRSFVAALGTGRGLARAIVGLTRDLDLDLIAEGVERPAQARWLADAGCRLVQGWLFSDAVDADRISSMLMADPARGAAGRRAV